MMKDFEDMNTNERLWFLHDQLNVLKKAYYDNTGHEVDEEDEDWGKVPFNPYGWNRLQDIDLDDEALEEYDAEDIIVAIGTCPEVMSRSANYYKYMIGFLDTDSDWGVCVVSSENVHRLMDAMEAKEDIWVKILVPHVGK